MNDFNTEYEDIMDEYEGDVISGILHAPGKFEGEHWSTVALWDEAMNGFATDTQYDIDGTLLSIFAIDDSDRAKYHMPADIVGVVLWETEQGFVCSSWMNEEEFSLFAKQILAKDIPDYE